MKSSYEILEQRLQAVAHQVSQYDHAWALIATGSMGLNPDSVDRYSDLDLLIVSQGDPVLRFIDDLQWLESISPIPWRYRYNEECVKFFFSDGIFCELSCITPENMKNLSYSGGRAVWARDGFDSQYCLPNVPKEHDLQRLLGELLTIMYIGLCKYRRGELLSACGYFFGQARDLFARISGHCEPRDASVRIDPFSPDRHFEDAFGNLQSTAEMIVQGYRNIPGSAEALMDFLESRFPIDRFISKQIRDLIYEESRQ